LNIEKKGIRALGIAESFLPTDEKSILAGVVMRADLVIDGVRYSRTSVKGDDASDRIIGLFKDFQRNDINVILIGGAVISLYNIIDPDRVNEETSVPVVLVTYRESRGLVSTLKKRFPKSWREKVQKYMVLGERSKLKLKSGYDVFVRSSGIREYSVPSILNRFTLQGAIPEPIRVAKMIAKAKLESERPI
jgi:endonuclease V-like protein UPF0215 family